MRKLLYLVTEDWYFCSHRLPLARAAHAAGYEVSVACRVRDHGTLIREAGIALHPLEYLSRSRRLDPWRELRALQEITRLYRALRPDIVHQVAVKPVILGSIAARRARVPSVVNALGGLGYVFTSDDLRARLVRPLVAASFRRLFARCGSRLIVQNPDDLRRFDPASTVLIAGSGVDTETFRPVPEPAGAPLVVLPARMLRDKGVFEFVEAARALRARGVSARFALVGPLDPDNPSFVPEATLRAWQQEGSVEWWGFREDMAAVLGESTLVCLPSWREGMPKVLAEAAACGRAIVTCDVPGCREIVQHGETGLLVPPRDSAALAAAIERLLGDAALRRRMADAGRAHAERFSARAVVEAQLELYAGIAPAS
jgi:glycosyltransferase involved in cell wall biosynthesis